MLTALKVRDFRTSHGENYDFRARYAGEHIANETKRVVFTTDLAAS